MSARDPLFNEEVRVEDLISDLKDPDKPIIPLRGVRIVGEFNLEHCIIDKPVEIQDCLFEGKVDFRYCEFKQVVDFSESTFREAFKNGDEIGSHTIYRKNLICDNAEFER